MNADLTDITLIVDRSGSMNSIRADAEGGIASFLAQQASEPGQALLTLVQFDNHYEVVHRGTPIDQAPPYRLEPRGSTALLDAIGRAVTDTGARLAALPEAERPGLVVVVIVTDGHENASVEYTRDAVRAMIERQQSVYQWQFVYLAADQDAFAEAGKLGMPITSAATYARHKMAEAYEGTSRKLSRMRDQTRRGVQVVPDFTDDERDDMV
jgi:uncharacterized protein YegL